MLPVLEIRPWSDVQQKVWLSVKRFVALQRSLRYGLDCIPLPGDVAEEVLAGILWMWPHYRCDSISHSQPG